jgi:hypothetical protein
MTEGPGPDPTGPVPVVQTAVLRPGRFDPCALLVLWCLRRAWWALLIGGLWFAWRQGRLDEQTVAELDDPAELARALLSPLAGVVLALAARAVAAVGSWWAALPLAGHALGAQPGKDARWWRGWGDRIHLAGALRSLRWTSGVRQAAAARLGRSGRVLTMLATGLAAAGPVLAVVFALDVTVQ